MKLKVLNIEGKEMRDCPYKCDNFDLAPGKCQYDQDCNACGNKRFEPEKQPTMENMETMEESNISSEELTGEKDSGYRGKQNKGCSWGYSLHSLLNRNMGITLYCDGWRCGICCVRGFSKKDKENSCASTSSVP